MSYSSGPLNTIWVEFCWFFLTKFFSFRFFFFFIQMDWMIMGDWSCPFGITFDKHMESFSVYTLNLFKDSHFFFRIPTRIYNNISIGLFFLKKAKKIQINQATTEMMTVKNFDFFVPLIFCAIGHITIKKKEGKCAVCDRRK